MSKPERNYTVGLIVLSLLFLLGICQFSVMIWKPLSPDLAKDSGVWCFVVVILAFYLSMTIAALWIFQSRPTWAALALAAINIMLIAYFPIGTYLAYYYFRKASKPPGPNDAENAAPTSPS